MTLTPEQFDKLVTRDEFLLFKDEFNEFREETNVKMDAIIMTLDGIAKTIGVNDAERVSNIAAHDRFETRITRTPVYAKATPWQGKKN